MGKIEAKISKKEKFKLPQITIDFFPQMLLVSQCHTPKAGIFRSTRIEKENTGAGKKFQIPPGQNDGHCRRWPVDNRQLGIPEGPY